MRRVNSIFTRLRRLVTRQEKQILRLEDHEILTWTRPEKGYFVPNSSGEGKGTRKAYSFTDLYYLKLIKLMKAAGMPPSTVTGFISIFNDASKNPLISEDSRFNFLSEDFNPAHGKDSAPEKHNSKLYYSLNCFVAEGDTDLLEVWLLWGRGDASGISKGPQQPLGCGRIGKSAGNRATEAMVFPKQFGLSFVFDLNFIHFKLKEDISVSLRPIDFRSRL